MSHKNIPAAYRLTHKPSGLYYVGSSSQLSIRLSAHRRELGRGTHRNKGLQSGYTTWSDISVDIFPAATLEEAREMEQKLLDENFGNRLCCNVGRSSTDPTLGVITSDMRRSALRIARLARGDTLTTEHKAALSASASRDPRSDDIRLKISLAKSRRVSCGGKEYASASEAAEALGLPSRTVRTRLYSESPTFSEWFFIN